MRRTEERPLRLIFILLTCLSATFAVAHQSEKGELVVTEISNNLYQFVSYAKVEGYGLVPVNGLVSVVDGKGVMIDTPWTDVDTEKLLAWFRKRDIEIIASLSTHFHQDRAGGIGFLQQAGVRTYASRETNKLLLEHDKATAQFELVVNPQIRWQTLGISRHQLEIFFPGAGHSTDNVVVWLPETSTLYGGCFVKSSRAKHLGYTADGDTDTWPSSIERVMKKYGDAKRVIPGHGTSGGIELLQHTQQLAWSLRQ